MIDVATPETLSYEASAKALHARLGSVHSQPITVSSFTNKRFTVNWRVPLEELRRIVPQVSGLEVEEIGDSSMGMLSMCACDFWITKLGPLPVPSFRNNDMLCRISVKIQKGFQPYRAYYTLRSDSSSRFLGFCGSHFSHFRKCTSSLVRHEDFTYYELECYPEDELCRGSFKAMLGSISKEKPATTIFRDVKAATDFVFQLDGSCGYSYEQNKLSFQHIDYPEWDIYFCHDYSYKFSLIEYLCQNYQLNAELDCVLFMQQVPQTWGTSWLYKTKTAKTSNRLYQIR